MRAKVNRELCNGAGMCEQTCPDVFELKSGIAVVKVKKIPSEAEQSCREAAENCPTEAISIEE